MLNTGSVTHIQFWVKGNIKKQSRWKMVPKNWRLEHSKRSVDLVMFYSIWSYRVTDLIWLLKYEFRIYNPEYIVK